MQRVKGGVGGTKCLREGMVSEHWSVKQNTYERESFNCFTFTSLLIGALYFYPVGPDPSFSILVPWELMVPKPKKTFWSGSIFVVQVHHVHASLVPSYFFIW